jgi:hypothetical protein
MDPPPLIFKLYASMASFHMLVGLRISICLDVLSIETLNLDTFNKDISTVEKFSTLWKRRSRQFKKRHLDQAYAMKSQFFYNVLIETLDLDTFNNDI